MYAYCLFCNTLKRPEAAASLRQRFEALEIVIPQIIQRKWVKGRCIEEPRDFLPSYLFAYSDEPLENPRMLQRVDNVARVLGEPECGYLLQGSNLAFARMLHDCGGTIGILKTYREGERVRLAKGALGGLEGEIIKLDRPKGRAQIQYQFDGAVYKTWVGYDMIDEPVKLEKAEA
ncbi:MAG: hypothetical protein IJ646_11065 [Clostridia bacterium]|nr:hypothetical protein [Clostridia bacterium]